MKAFISSGKWFNISFTSAAAIAVNASNCTHGEITGNVTQNRFSTESIMYVTVVIRG